MVGSWLGDPGTQINHGPSTPGSDLLYATKTERKAFGPTPSGLGTSTKISPLPRGFATHLDEVTAEENLFRYTESLLTGNAFNALIGGNALPAFGLPGLTGTMADGTPIADIDASPIAKFNLEWRPD